MSRLPSLSPQRDDGDQSPTFMSPHRSFSERVDDMKGNTKMRIKQLCKQKHIHVDNADGEEGDGDIDGISDSNRMRKNMYAANIDEFMSEHKDRYVL